MKKRLIIIGCVAAGVLIMGASVWVLASGGSSKTVEVFPVSQISDSGFGNAYSTGGVIKSDAAQEIYLSENDKIKKMYVKEGDQVKKGDKLFSYDTSQMNLDVEIKKMDKKIADLKIQAANVKLEKLRKEKPYTPPPEPADDSDEEELEEMPKKENPKETGKDKKEEQKHPEENKKDQKKEKEGNIQEKDIQSVQTKSEDEEGQGQEEEGRTKEDINKDIEDTMKALRDAQLSKKKADLELKRAEEKLENQSVRKSTVNGIVKKAGDPKEGRQQDGSPFMVVSGEDGLYVKGSVDEKILEKFTEGLMVMGSAWEAGIDFTAQVTEISEYPMDDPYFSDGSNTTYYEFTALIEEPGDLKNNDYVDLQVSLSDDTNGESFYLDKMYIRDEDGEKVVWISDENSQLKRQVVQTGKTLWGSYIEVKEGLTMENKIAFPYGKEVKEGTKTYSEFEEEEPEMVNKEEVEG